MALLEVQNLCKTYQQRVGVFKKSKEIVALHDVSFQVEKGMTVALVGETGCGKSTLGRCILRLTEPTKGKVFYDGICLNELSPSKMKPLRRRMQMVFQDPHSSLNPGLTVGAMLEEPLKVFHLCSTKAEIGKRAEQLLDLVELSSDTLTRYPSELSGGQKQRVSIARVLSLEPEFIICDEPVSSLDVSVQAGIMNLLMDLQDKLNLTYLFISHDLNMVQRISHRVMLMYEGKIVEQAEGNDLFDSPKHSYTKELIHLLSTSQVST